MGGLLTFPPTEPATKTWVTLGWGDFRRNLSWQPLQVLGHPQSKKVFPNVQMGPPVFLKVPVASGPATEHY